jgi:hypothetical protein
VLTWREAISGELVAGFRENRAHPALARPQRRAGRPSGVCTLITGEAPATTTPAEEK